MQSNCRTAWLLSALTLFGSLALAIVVYVYLPLHRQREASATAIVIVGLIGSAAVYAIVMALPAKPWVRIAACALFAAMLSTPVASIFMHRVTYARFGLTVYGLVPVPVLDITVNSKGVLWFREKTHRVTRAEIERLLSFDTEIVIIGTGWDNLVQLDDAAATLRSHVDIRMLPTPDAIALYNLLVSEGRVVVLLLHSTC